MWISARRSTRLTETYSGEQHLSCFITMSWDLWRNPRGWSEYVGVAVEIVSSVPQNSTAKPELICADSKRPCSLSISYQWIVNYWHIWAKGSIKSERLLRWTNSFGFAKSMFRWSFLYPSKHRKWLRPIPEPMYLHFLFPNKRFSDFFSVLREIQPLKCVRWVIRGGTYFIIFTG